MVELNLSAVCLCSATVNKKKAATALELCVTDHERSGEGHVMLLPPNAISKA
jgi:hypothetical protein